ncbi:DUF6961 family protein [Stakelama flava]|uniref:DUF6961 family protein n=1 Tax=Stakelama flava TaxID=2860338 RepID=UPI001FEBC684|nr:hypothetical protein [Stakelama flava]
MSRPLEDWELWGAATMVVRQHGDRAPAFVAERIGVLALAGDSRGMDTWKRIASRVAQLMDNNLRKH